MDWLTQNMNAIVAILLALHGLAVVIVNLTPTPADDKVLGKVYKLIELIGGLWTKRAKDPPQ